MLSERYNLANLLGFSGTDNHCSPCITDNRSCFGFYLRDTPPSQQGLQPWGNYGRDTKYNPNTNLEDVSDWLTKIILGVTLTQLGKIPGYLQSIADYILVNADCENLNCDFARPIMIAVLIYFFCCRIYFRILLHKTLPPKPFLHHGR